MGDAFSVLLGVVIVIFLFWLWKERQEGEDSMPTPNPNTLYDKALAQMDENRKEMEKENLKTMVEEQKGTRDLFLDTLTKIGCQYELAKEEDDDRIYFAYQGEHFFVRASNDCGYIQIFDTHWGHVELYDIDEFTRLKRAINLSNLNNSVTTVYTIDEAGSNVDVHCKSVILFVPQIPDIEKYLRTELNDYFCVHRFVGNEMAKMREQEEATKA
jgi:nitrogen fixation-related uncharacterized protein